jgi:hypothetical protein
MTSPDFHLECTHLGLEIAIRLSKQVIIGRRKDDGDTEVELDLSPDQSVSRRHARVWVENGRCWIEDLGSAGGTTVDGRDIRDCERVELKPGVPVIIGAAEIRLAPPLEPPRPSAIETDVRCLTSFNYSLAHADVPFVQGLTLTNKGSETLSELEVQVTVLPYAESDRVRVSSLPAGHTMSLSGMRFEYHRQPLLHRVEPDTVPLEVQIDGRPAALVVPVSVRVLPVRSWHCVGHEPVLASFILKESDAVKDVIGRARATLRYLARGCNNFEDVLEHHADPVRKTVEILYNCLQERYEIAYGREPRYYGTDWQMIRFPADVLDPKTLEGTCIDLALLLAACMENRSLSPVIVLIQTGIDLAAGFTVQHALVGCWNGSSPRWKKPGPTDPIETNGQFIKAWLDSGDLILLDPVGYAHGKVADHSFKDSQESARRHLDCALTAFPGYAFRYAVDIEVARIQGIEPLPFGAEIEFDRDAWLAIFRARREAALRGSPAAGGRHLLLGLLSLPDGVLAQALTHLETDLPEKVADQVRTTLGAIVSTRTRSPWKTTPDWESAIEAARLRAKNEGRLLVGEADLAIALLEKSPKLRVIMNNAGVTSEQCLEEMHAVLKSRRGFTRWPSSVLGI